MSIPSRKAPPGLPAISTSTEVYRLLLVAYPAAFRREYGAHMIQAFRDCAREELRSGGIVGLWRYWLSALGDLVISAFAERRREELRMSRTFWIRIGSLAGLAGGITSALAAALALVIGILQLFDQHSPAGLAVFPFQFATQRLAPALALCFVLTLVGLRARGAERAGVPGWIGIAFAVMGEALIGLGGIMQSVVMNGQANACRTPLNCNFYDPHGYLAMGYLTALLGSLIFAIGMIIYGLVALRSRVLARANGLPLAIGLLAIANGTVGYIATLVSYETDYAGMEKIVIILALAPLASAVTWAFLASALWTRDAETAVAQAA